MQTQESCCMSEFNYSVVCMCRIVKSSTFLLRLVIWAAQMSHLVTVLHFSGF